MYRRIRFHQQRRSNITSGVFVAHLPPPSNYSRLLTSGRCCSSSAAGLVVALVLLLSAAFPAVAAAAPLRDYVYVYKGPPNPQFGAYPVRNGRPHPRSPYIPRPGEFLFINGQDGHTIYVETSDGYQTALLYDERKWKRDGWVFMRAADYPPATEAKSMLIAEEAVIDERQRQREREESAAEAAVKRDLILLALGVFAFLVTLRLLTGAFKKIRVSAGTPKRTKAPRPKTHQELAAEQAQRELWAERMREEACLREERLRKAKVAAGAGLTVCWECLTVEPEKMCSRCGNCMSCGGGEYYPSLCYRCDSGN